MANSLTNEGEENALLGNGSTGSIARLATNLLLFDNTSVPLKDGTGFVEVGDGNGYIAGTGKVIAVGNWTFSVVSLNGQIVLDDQVFTATPGSIANILGAFIVDTAGLELAWWERTTAVTLDPGDTLTADDLTIRLT